MSENVTSASLDENCLEESNGHQPANGKSAAEVARLIIQGVYEDARSKILAQAKLGIKVEDINCRLNGQIPWPENSSPGTRENHLRTIIKALLGNNFFTQSTNTAIARVRKDSEYRDLRIKIIALCDRGASVKEILAATAKEFPWPPGTAPSTQESKMMQLIREYGGEKRKEKMNERRGKTLLDNADSARDGITKKLADQGIQSFTREEAEYFAILLGKQKKNKRGEHDHEKLAAKMNEKFNTEKFTQERCRYRLYRMRYGTANNRKHRAKKKETTNGSTLEKISEEHIEEPVPQMSEEEQISSLRKSLGVKEPETKEAIPFVVLNGENEVVAGIRRLAEHFQKFPGTAFAKAAEQALEADFQTAQRTLENAMDPKINGWKVIQYQFYGLLLAINGQRQHAQTQLEHAVRLKNEKENTDFSDLVEIPEPVIRNLLRD